MPGVTLAGRVGEPGPVLPQEWLMPGVTLAELSQSPLVVVEPPFPVVVEALPQAGVVVGHSDGVVPLGASAETDAFLRGSSLAHPSLRFRPLRTVLV